MLPEKIGHYSIVSELGRGGMGVVYKAREEALNRFVAIKVLTEQLTEDATFLQRFVREAQAAAALSHPNIVQIFFIGEDNGHPFFVMEYVTGRSLNHLLRDEGRIDNPRASQLILQAAHGLAAAHDQGIVHRDIKPANLILDERGIVKIADFGLALPADAETRLTASGMLVGTPGYLAPEQCRGEKVDNRTDIYALGVTFYLLLSGQAPFRGESPLALLRQILDEQPPDISTLNPNVDAETRRILEKMIAKDREQRYQNCHDLVSDLEDYLAKNGVRSMTAGLATRKTAASDAAVVAAAVASTPASTSQQSALTQRTLKPVAAAPAAPPVAPSVHDSPTMRVSPSNEPVTMPDAPLVQPKTQPPMPIPVAAPAQPNAAATYTPPPPASSNGRTLAILAVVVLMLIAAAVLLARNFFSGKSDTPAVAAAAKPQPPQTASTATTATTSNPPDGALLLNQVNTPTIGDGATSVPPATTTTTSTAAAALQPQSQPRSRSQQQQPAVQRAAALTPTTPPRGAAGGAVRTTPAAESKPRGLSGVAFAVTGDQGLVGSVSSVISSELSAAGLNGVDAETLPSTEDMVRHGDVSTSRLIDKLRGEGIAVLLLVRVDPAGQRELNFMGRHDTAFSSRVTLTTYDVASGRAFGTPNKGTVEYTSATADRESEKIVGKLARASVEAIQNR
jgi:serine/threonine-protein kinase